MGNFLTVSPRLNAKRADAEHNRHKILTAARSVFAESNGEASMAAISRRAGVGIATLYRNFPSRRDLLEALYTDDVDAICKAALSEGAAPSVALVSWLEKFFAFAVKKRNVAVELLEHSERNDPVFTESRARVLAAGRPLLARAQRADAVRNDVKIEQILDLVVALSGIQGEARYLRPILRTALDGLLLGPTDSAPRASASKRDA